MSTVVAQLMHGRSGNPYGGPYFWRELSSSSLVLLRCCHAGKERRPVVTGINGRSLDSRMQDAIDELSGLILASYPGARFAVRPHPEEPSITLLVTTVDIDDVDDVIDVVLERMQQFNIEEDVPILVVPVHPIERSIAMLAARSNESLSSRAVD
jgi:hypothetical protein